MKTKGHCQLAKSIRNTPYKPRSETPRINEIARATRLKEKEDIPNKTYNKVEIIACEGEMSNAIGL